MCVQRVASNDMPYHLLHVDSHILSLPSSTDVNFYCTLCCTYK